MAAISQQVSPQEVLPLLARNVVVTGYQGDKPTEFLMLLNRYMQQAKELRDLAGAQALIRVSNCEDAKPLLAILGYRSRPPCGPTTSLETSDADRAFVTIDSGFPLSELEEALRNGTPFTVPFTSTQVPVVFSKEDWTFNSKAAGRNDLVENLIHDPGLSHLYWAMSRIDSESRTSLLQSPGLRKLMPYAAVLDFYGSQITIQSGHVVVPGGTAAEAAWADVVGASPEKSGEFVEHLLAKDEGWVASYFDALSRVSQSQQAYFTQPARLKKFYAALRGTNISPSPTRHAFRPDQSLVLLLTRLEVDPNGKPHVPGNLDVWKDVFRRKSNSKILRDWGNRAAHWNDPEQLAEGLIAISRVTTKDGPLQDFMMVSEIDRRRSPGRLSPETARLLAERFQQFGDQYLIFSEFSGLTDASITRFFAVADALDRIPNRILRADCLGILQANIGLWEILARQRQIPEAKLNDSWMRVIGPFATVQSPSQLFDVGRASFGDLLRSATGKAVLSQDEVITLLAGPDPISPEGQQVRQEMANRIRAVMDDQRLVSTDTLFALADGLDQLAKGKEVRTDILVPLAGQLREFEMPKPLFTTRERSELAAGLYSNRHTSSQMRTDLTKVITTPGTPVELAAARGLMSPFLRDTLVGLNYAYYEPPGAQMLHHNPLFVRSHDFSGGDFSGQATTALEHTWQTPSLFGRGWTASGGAHLVGSLADLPYVLSQVEQAFIVPSNVQSLIWEDLVPGLMTSAVLPRWWGISRNELHAVTLYQRAGEELLAATARDEKLRRSVMDILSNCMLPQRAEQMARALGAEHHDDLLTQVTPAESFYLAAEFRPTVSGQHGVLGKRGEGTG